VVSASLASATFTWDAVADQGDGAGQDYFEAGLDHYTSWITVDGGPPMQRSESLIPLTIREPLARGQSACLHVVAFDRVGNASADRGACAKALEAPPMPDWGPLGVSIVANPLPVGLVGLDSWLWLDPTPQPIQVDETIEGVLYRIRARPLSAAWDFGDGDVSSYTGSTSFGVPFPSPSQVTHVFQAHSRLGYVISAAITYSVRWSVLVGGAWLGPYPMGTVARAAVPLVYPVEQAQPVLLELGVLNL
jgi:hypothetical protein